MDHDQRGIKVVNGVNQYKLLILDGNKLFLVVDSKISLFFLANRS